MRSTKHHISTEPR